jgi:hypothetical protein
MSQAFTYSHSAEVEMWLECGEHGEVHLSRVTPKSVVAKIAREIPPCIANLVVTVDGRRMCNRVKLTSGFSRGRRMARVLSFDDVAPF